MPDEVTADDFVVGLFAALVREGFPTVSMREEWFYESVEAGYQKLCELVEAEPDVAELDFRVRLDPLYGDSAVVRNAINATVQLTFLSLDNPEFVTIRSKLDVGEAAKTLDYLPGRPEWYGEVAKAFLTSHGAVPA